MAERRLTKYPNQDDKHLTNDPTGKIKHKTKNWLLLWTQPLHWISYTKSLIYKLFTWIWTIEWKSFRYDTTITFIWA